MRSSSNAFVSIGKLYCRQATATRFGFERLTDTCGKTEANFAVFLLMLISITPGVRPGSGAVWDNATPNATNTALAVDTVVQSLVFTIVPPPLDHFS